MLEAPVSSRRRLAAALVSALAAACGGSGDGGGAPPPSREEIDRIVKGGNYGWDCREGDQSFDPDPNCTPPFVDPELVHGRSEAQSIAGGYVYRGSAIPFARQHLRVRRFRDGPRVRGPLPSEPVPRR